MVYERLWSALSHTTRLTPPHKSWEHFIPRGLSCTIYTLVDSPRQNCTKYTNISLSYCQLFTLPKLKASQKFSVHMHVGRPQAQLRELKEVKDRRYNLKEGNSKLKQCGK